MKFYRVSSRSLWGDYGNILISGMSRHLPRKDNLIQLERTGPFIPPITLPGIGDIVVTSDLKNELEGFQFHPTRFRPSLESEDRRVPLGTVGPYDREARRIPGDRGAGELHSGSPALSSDRRATRRPLGSHSAGRCRSRRCQNWERRLGVPSQSVDMARITPLSGERQAACNRHRRGKILAGGSGERVARFPGGSNILGWCDPLPQVLTV